MVDDDDLHGTSGGLEFQTELLLDRGENGRTGEVRRIRSVGAPPSFPFTLPESSVHSSLNLYVPFTPVWSSTGRASVLDSTCASVSIFAPVLVICPQFREMPSPSVACCSLCPFFAKTNM